MSFHLLKLFRKKEKTSKPPTEGSTSLQATPDATRCIQCGICIYNCPVGIEVREYARRGENVTDSRCIGCGICIEKCPRGTLRWGPAVLVRPDNTLVVVADELPETLKLRSRNVR